MALYAWCTHDTAHLNCMMVVVVVIKYLKNNIHPTPTIVKDMYR